MKKILIPLLCFLFCIVCIVLVTYKYLASKEKDIPIAVVKSEKNIIKEGENILPIFDNLTLSVRGFETEVDNIDTFSSNVFNLDYNPTIKVTATDARDIDGFISYYKWYYYYKDDLNRKLEVKVTPGTENYTYFQLKEPGEYMFGVTIYDNNEGKSVSEEILRNGPTVLLIHDSNIPLVTLKVDKAFARVGEELTFHVFSKIIPEKNDFEQERIIRYDFDGDGVRDLITNEDDVTYVYEKSYYEGVIPRASVLYGENVGIANGGSIIVRNPGDSDLY